MTDEQKLVVMLMGENCITCECCEDLELCKAQKCSVRLAMDLIEQLAADLERVTRERDALMNDLRGACHVCAHKSHEKACLECSADNHWEWRGLCAENGGAEDVDKRQG